MKNSIKSVFAGLLILVMVPQVFAQVKKGPTPISKTQAQINKFEDENYKLVLENIRKVEKERIKQIKASTEERIKAAKAKIVIHKGIIRGAGPDASQRYQLQIQEVENNLIEKEKAATEEFQKEHKKLYEEFLQKIAKRRFDFYK